MLHIGNVSEAMQNLMMGHGDIRTFLRHYLPRRVTVDTAAVVRGLDPQTSVMQSACMMSRWINPNRPWGLIAEQADSVNNDSLIQSLLNKRIKLKQCFRNKSIKLQVYNILNKKIRSEKQQLRNELKT